MSSPTSPLEVPPVAAPADASEDVRQLASMGYAQELRRRMNGFSNFAISFSIICILAGGITSLQLGISAIGGAAAGIVWPIGAAFALIVAACMAQVASAYPTAGGLYHWSSLLGGRGWGWATAWLNLGGLIFVTAAVNVGAWSLLVGAFAPLFGVDPASLGVTHQIIGVTCIAISQALLNHYDIRITTLLTDFSGYLILAVTAILVVSMLAWAPSLEFSRLVTVANFSGPAGGDVWPANTSVGSLFLLGLMWPIYTITGFDASAHTSEETVNAARNVPRGILRSVIVSGVVGWVMVCAFVLAMPSVADGAKQGGNVFFWIVEKVIPAGFGRGLLIGIAVANYLCGLACVTSTSRMIFAFARDGGLPGSATLRRVNPRTQTPVAAVWTTAVLAVACTLYSPAYSTLTTACVILLYLSYVMPGIAGSFAFGKTWTKMGPFNLGRGLYRFLATLSVAGIAVLVWVGIQPPNEKALPVTAAAVGLLLVAWWAGVRRHFRGPPVMDAGRKI